MHFNDLELFPSDLTEKFQSYSRLLNAVAQTVEIAKLKDIKEGPIFRQIPELLKDVKKLDLHQMSVIYHCQKMTCIFFQHGFCVEISSKISTKTGLATNFKFLEIKKIAHLTENEWRIWI